LHFIAKSSVLAFRSLRLEVISLAKEEPISIPNDFLVSLFLFSGSLDLDDFWLRCRVSRAAVFALHCSDGRMEIYARPPAFKRAK
jgi:hypothetical protein